MVLPLKIDMGDRKWSSLKEDTERSQLITLNLVYLKHTHVIVFLKSIYSSNEGLQLTKYSLQVYCHKEYWMHNLEVLADSLWCAVVCVCPPTSVVCRIAGV